MGSVSFFEDKRLNSLDPLSLVLSFKRPHLRWFVALGRHSDVETVTLCKVISSTNADCGRNVGHQLIVVRIVLLEDADYPFSADHVNAFARWVKENIVALTRRTNTGDFPSGLRIQHDHHWGFARDGEQAMIFFVQGHRIITTQVF